MKELKNLIFHMAIWFGLILGFTFDITGAYNVVLFILWFVSIISLTFLMPDFLKEIAKDYRPSKLRNLWQVSSWAIVGFLVWNGAILTGIAYVIALLISISAQSKMKELRNEN